MEIEASGSTADYGANLTVRNGAQLVLTNMTSLYVTNGGVNIWAYDAGSLIDLSGVTNLVLTSYQLYLAADSGSKVDLRHMPNVAGPLNAEAQGAGAVLDLSGFQGRWTGGANARLDMEYGGSVLIPGVTELQQVPVYAYAVTNVLGITNLLSCNLTVRYGAHFVLTNVTSLYVTNGGVNIWAYDAGSLIDLSGVTNLVLTSYQLYLAADSGSKVDLRHMPNVAGPLNAEAQGAGAVLDLSGFQGRWTGGANARLDMEYGGSVLIPGVTELQQVPVYAYAVTNVLGITNLLSCNLTVRYGAHLVLTNVTSLYVTNGGVNILAYDAGTLIDLSGVTNLVLTSYQLAVEAINGAKIDLRRMPNVAGPLYAEAYGAGAVLDLSAFQGRWTGGANAELDMEYGGSVLIPGVTELQQVTVVAFAVTNVMGITNLLSCNLTVRYGAQLVLTNVTSLYVTNGGVNILAYDAGTLIDLSGVTNLVLTSYQLAVEAINGAKIDLRRMPNVAGPLYAEAYGAGAVLDLSAFQGRWTGGANAELDMEYGGSVLIPGVTELQQVTVVAFAVTNVMGITNLLSCNLTVRYGAQLVLTNVTSLYVTNGGVNILAYDAGTLIDLSGVTNLVLTSYQLAVEAINGAKIDLHRMPNVAGPLYAEAYGAGAVLDLSAFQGRWTGGANAELDMEYGGSVLIPGVTELQQVTVVAFAVTNVMGITNLLSCNLTVRYGAQLVLTNVTSLYVTNGGVNILAYDAGTLLDLSGVTNLVLTSYQLAVEAINGAKIDLHRMPNVAGPLYAEAYGAGAVLDLSAFQGRWTGGANAELDMEYGGSVLIPGVTELQQVTVVAFAVTNVMGITNLLSCNLTVRYGAQLVLTNVTSLYVTNGGVNILAYDAGTLIDLSGVTNLVLSPSYSLDLEAYSGAKIDTRHVPDFSVGTVYVFASGASSVIDLSALSSFVTRNGTASTLNATSGGQVLLSNEEFLLANVSVNFAGNLVVPPVIASSPSMTLYGKAWHSYWVQQRNTSNPANGWQFVVRVPLTNSVATFAATVPPNTAYRVWEFVADPPILDLSLLPGQQYLLVLYGATNKTYQVQSRADLRLPTTWGSAAVVSMTNAFRILPPAPVGPAGTRQFFRAKEQ